MKSVVSKTIKYVLDAFIPAVIRDSRLFYVPLIKLWNPRMDPDFKVKALSMTDEEVMRQYEALVPMRDTDMTPKTTDFVLNRLTGETVLETGCGNGQTAIAVAEKGFRVTATDLAEGNLTQLRNTIADKNLNMTVQQADIEKLPFADNSFDTVLCLHTLEHVRNLWAAVSELKRVTRQKLIIIVPKQKYFRYTCDYHLHFFDAPEQLMLTIQIPDAECQVIDNCLCYAANLS